MATTINAEAKDAAGLAHPVYVRTKVIGVVASFGRTICRLADYPEESNHAFLVRGVVRSWARDAAARGRSRPARARRRREAWLRRFDLPYRARRLRFVIDGLNEWYAHVGNPGTRREPTSTTPRASCGLRAPSCSTRWTVAGCSRT